MTNKNSLDRGLVTNLPSNPGPSGLFKCFSKSSIPKVRPGLLTELTDGMYTGPEQNMFLQHCETSCQ